MEHRITVGQLRNHLKLYPDDFDLIFGGGNLKFYRVKLRGQNIVQIEFSQTTEMVPDVPEE
jgi:hypothetical protein